jgi:1,2-dihydroxy-3-keto-5-methylthiopentene dioxygenase
MTILNIYREDDPATVVSSATALPEIKTALQRVGVRFERWPCEVSLPEDATADDVLAAYRHDVDRLCAEDGYVTVDVARLAGDRSDPGLPAKAAEARARFLAEHTHDDDEVRFFVEGSGAFYLRIDGLVHVVVCTAGDLISVPAETRHWFDMGSEPHFAAIRFFRVADGWVGQFTGDPIAERFVSFDALVR